MKLKNIDHMVITTENLEKCLHFYVDMLHMEHECIEGHHAVKFGNEKINIHTAKGEFQPAAGNVTYGSQDFCLIAKGDIYEIKEKLQSCGCQIIEGVVERIGTLGPMNSIYLRDPDGNLVEIAVYP